MSTGHAKLAPSHAECWVNCPGSIAMCEGLPEDPGSEYAEEGTRAHAVAAARLKRIPGPAADSKEASDFINVYVNAVLNASEGKMLLVENSIHVGEFTTEPDGKGTADAMIYDAPSETLEVHDLKFGMGHIVDAPNNKQMTLYALGGVQVLEELIGFKVQRIKMVIHQPRRDHISSWEITREELDALIPMFQSAGSLALNGAKGENLNPSEKACLWCPAKAFCPALTALVHKETFDFFAEVDGQLKAVTKPYDVAPPPNILEMIEQWVAAVREKISETLTAGGAVPGWKLVQGRAGNRKFTDEAKVVKLLKKLKFKKGDIYETSLLSLASLEKLVPKEQWAAFQPLITQAPGKPTVAAESDKRPAYTPARIEDFENLL